MKHAWRALRHRNFKLFFCGQSISVIGTWMTRLATMWLIYRLTRSAWLLGIAGFASQIVPFLLQPVAGVWVERMNRRRLLVWTQVASAIQSLALAALALEQIITVWEIIGLMALQGFIGAFDSPARQSFIVEMIEDRNDLGNAIAINSVLTNIGGLLGPALAGLVIGAVGEGLCFLIDGVSYLAVIGSLLMMRVPSVSPHRHRKSFLGQMREGWDYVRTFQPIRMLLLQMSLTALAGCPYSLLLPIFAGQVFRGGPHVLGWLTGASGMGALIAALSLAFRKPVVGMARMVPISSAILGAALIGFSLSHRLWLSLTLMGLAGFALMKNIAVSNMLIQTLVPENKRSRVMSYYVMVLFGAAPLGSLWVGTLADKAGAPVTILIMGVLCIFASFWSIGKMSKGGDIASQYNETSSS